MSSQKLPNPTLTLIILFTFPKTVTGCVKLLIMKIKKIYLIKNISKYSSLGMLARKHNNISKTSIKLEGIDNNNDERKLTMLAKLAFDLMEYVE